MRNASEGRAFAASNSQLHRPKGEHVAAFEEVAVTFPSAAGSVALAGTLVVPSERPDSPLAVLVSGTGPIDRDVTFVGHALFRVLAHALAEAGIASLRFDKRGVGESEGDFSSAGPGDFVADVVGAMEYVVGQTRFARDRVGLNGHSEGGMVALTAAARRPGTPYCVLLASPLLSGTDNLVRSFALLARGGLERDRTFDRYVSELETLVKGARSGMAPESRTRALDLAARLAPRIFNERTKVILGASALSGLQFLNLLSSPCLETSLSWDPSRVAPHVKCPVLVIYGTKDVQAPALENLAAARLLIDRLGRRDWVVRELGGMNHAFQRCQTGMPDEYACIDHVMGHEVVGEVAAWIASTTHAERCNPVAGGRQGRGGPGAVSPASAPDAFSRRTNDESDAHAVSRGRSPVRVGLDDKRPRPGFGPAGPGGRARRCRGRRD
jgi:pimeloyl-ACP methyl ester carboxylesterase